MKRAFFTLFLLAGMLSYGAAQNLFINEVQSSNNSTIIDHTGNSPDWIEVFNGGTAALNLKNYGLSDVDSLPFKWTFPSVTIAPDSHLLVYASGLDLKEPVLHWETIFDLGDEWKYYVPKTELPASWKNNGFDDSSWLLGKSGFGYGDGDDSTVLETTMSVFIRKRFTILDRNDLPQAFLHIDFDDAFVAYLNGVEIARSNIGQPGIAPAFDDPAYNYNYEAVIHSGGFPSEFLIDDFSNYLVDGENVLAIQVHNHSLTSSDLSAIPIFTIGHSNYPSYQISISPYIKLIPIGLHTNFKISSSGDHIILTDSSGNQIDSIFTVDIPADVSLGRKPDGNENWKFFEIPTPGSSNISEGFSTLPASLVHFSSEGGFYQNGINLNLSTSISSDSIFYTLDGSEPTKESLFYVSQILIDKTTMIRARVIASGHLPSEVTTNSYLINETHELPVVFVGTDPYNLWDYNSGIYVKGPNAQFEFPYKGANFWQDWERPANIAMYEPDGSLAFQINASIKIFGAYSRGHDQKSISVHCRKSYGDERINYKLFDDLDNETFKTIILRNSGNDFNNTMLRDAFCNRIVSSLDLDQQAYRPAVVYLNGAYWGIQNIREKINEEFLVYHHGINEDEIDILEREGQAIRGNSEHYDQLISYLNSHNLSSDENYKYVTKQIDINNFIKYQIAQIFIDNRDWPGNNMKYWRERSPRGKWRWILFDLDFGLNTWDSDNQSFNTLEYAMQPNGPGWPNPPWSTFLLRKLVENESFKYDFINCFADNLNTIFEPSTMESQLIEMKAAIQNEIPDHMNRWNGEMGYWRDRISAMTSFIRQRRGSVRNHIRSVFGLSGMYEIEVDVDGEGQIMLNTLELDRFPWEGKYFNNIPIILEAIPKPGYKFVKWNGIETTDKEQLTVTANEPVEITAVFDVASISPNDIIINEINYNSNLEFDPGDWLELLNTSDHSINISGWVIKDDDDNHEFIIPEGTVIKSHGFILVCRNYEKFSVLFPEVEVIEGTLDFGFGSGGDCIRLFTDNGLLIDKTCYENNTPWPSAPNGSGATLALADALSNNEHPANWISSKIHGTPGSKNVDIITSVNQSQFPDNLNFVRIFPNPVESIVHINFNGISKDLLSISMSDISGRAIVLIQDYAMVEGENSIEINLDQIGINITPGLYLFSLKSNSVQKQVKVIVR